MARRRPPSVHGVAVVDKPAGVTSHDVVGMLRRRLGERRIGHAGTLDPSATGVLVVGVGHVTRLLRFVTEGTKRYSGEVVLGVETDSLDADGVVTATFDMAPVDLPLVREVVTTNLTGVIQQIPPMVSALKVDGRRLHELAREGIHVERQPRTVTVERFDVLGSSQDPDGRQVLSIDVTCTAGTYIRTLAADLGTLLGGGAHLRHLRRTMVALFTIDEAAPPDTCELLASAAALRSMTTIVADAELAARIANGAVLESPGGDGPWGYLDEAGEVLAVYEAHRGGLAKPAVVIPR